MAEKKEPTKKDATPESTGRKKKLIIIIGVSALVLILLLGGGAFFFLKKSHTDEEKHDPGKDVPVPSLDQAASIGPMVDISGFIVNIISADGNHYVKASLTLELTNPTVKDEITKRMPQIRDAILLLVGNKTFEELQDLEGKKQLKAEIMSKLNGILQTGKIKAIFFTEFVVQ